MELVAICKLVWAISGPSRSNIIHKTLQTKLGIFNIAYIAHYSIQYLHKNLHNNRLKSYTIQGLIKSGRSTIEINNSENHIGQCKCPKDQWIASVGFDNPQLLNVLSGNAVRVEFGRGRGERGIAPVAQDPVDVADGAQDLLVGGEEGPRAFGQLGRAKGGQDRFQLGRAGSIRDMRAEFDGIDALD